MGMKLQRKWPSGVTDVAMAVGVAGFVLAGAAFAPAGRTELDLLGYVLLLAPPLSLVTVRRFPAAVLLVATACVTAYLVRGYPGVAVALPLMVAISRAVRNGHRWVLLVPVGAMVFLILVDVSNTGGGPAARQVVHDRFLLLGWLVASATMGSAFRWLSAYVKEVEERAAEAERTREETARRRAADERLRIARDLHDSLTHSISIIKVQAGVAVHLARKRGEEVPEALEAVQEASREAMRELRATLEVLRESDGEPAGAGLDGLPELVERTRAAGLPATVTVSGEKRALPGRVDRAAFRIVQEALTNATRHAGPASASVLLDYGADRLTVRVEDDGLATREAPPVPGVGLTGMRERVTALGGQLVAEPRPEGGFSVRAELPFGDAPPEPEVEAHAPRGLETGGNSSLRSPVP